MRQKAQQQIHKINYYIPNYTPDSYPIYPTGLHSCPGYAVLDMTISGSLEASLALS